MIIILWIILLTISLTFLYLGKKFDSTSSDILTIAGWVFIFILGIIMLFNQVKYETGIQTTTTNTYTTDSFNNTILSNYTTNEIKTYENFQNETDTLIGKLDGSHIFGLLLALIGGFGFATFWYDIKNERKDY